MKYLFLDFDGVLHGEQENWELFSHMNMLCSALLSYKDSLRIVISSSWREDYPLAVLQSHFWSELRSIVIGVTPIHESSFDPLARFGEIKDYCQKNNISDEHWMALDDMARLFPENCTNLILTNAKTGLTKENLMVLIDFLDMNNSNEKNIYAHI